jgi:transposase
MQVTTIGVDLAKSVFQVHGVGASGETLMVKTLRRGQLLTFFSRLSPCLVGLEACGSAHDWARRIAALGHEVRLIAPAYVKPYVRRNKTDAADAAAICEAVGRPSMRFVAIKTPERQAVMSMHKARALLVTQRQRLSNAIRAHLAEYGVVAPAGRAGLTSLLVRLERGELEIPAPLQAALRAMVQPLTELAAAIAAVEKEIRAWHFADQQSRNLQSAPGFGPLIASAVAASLTDPKAFRSARAYAASLGLTPRIDATGGKARLGRVSKRGDRYLRRLLVNGAQALLSSKRAKTDPWLARLLAQKSRKLAAIAVANKLARIAFAMLSSGQPYRPPEPLAADG